MHNTAIAKLHAWLVAGLLAALLGFIVYAATVASNAAEVDQLPAVRTERLSTDFVAALHVWSLGVRDQAIGANAAPGIVGPALVVADASALMGLQAALARSPDTDDSRILLQRVVDDRAEVAAARDLVVQLRSAGEIKRANIEFETRLLPTISRLIRKAELLKSELREVADAVALQRQQNALRAAHAVQVVSALGLLAALVLAAMLRSARAALDEERAPQQALPANRPPAALEAQALLQRTLRAGPLVDRAVQVSSGVRQPVGADS